MLTSSSNGTLGTFVNLAHVVLARSKIIVFVVLVLAAFGVRSYANAPQSIFPAMSFARIDVVADAGDLTPEQVRVAVTRPLAAALGTLPAATRVRSTSSQGSAEAIVDFDPATDPHVDLQAAQAAIASLQPTLPAAKRIEAVIVNASSEPVLSIGLTSRVLSQAALTSFVTARVLPVFAGTPGLSRTTVVGGPPVEYRVELAPTMLAALHLSAADVAGAIAAATNVVSVGTAQRYAQRYVIVLDAAIHDARALGTIPVPLAGGGTIPLRALGSVRLGVGAATAQAAVDGTHAVMLSAFALPGADVVKTARAFTARLDAVRGALPADVALVTYWDQTRLIVESQRSLRDAILLGALLAVVVIALFLRSVRLTLVAGAIIPLALALAILLLERAGQSLNLMSVGGLAIAVGLIIDDTIVVVEAIARALAERPSAARAQTIAAAVAQIAGPMAASTLATVVVFVPLGMLSGVSGCFFRALAFTLCSALIVSLALAIGVAPIFADAFVGRSLPHAAGSGFGAAYVRLVRWALGHRAIVFAASAVVLATTVGLFALLPSDFLPKLDEGEFEITFTLPSGATLAASDGAAGAMERIVLADPDVRAVGRLVGVDTNGFTPTQLNVGTLRVMLRSGRRASYDAIAQRLRASLTATVPAATYDVHQLLEDQINDVSGAPQPLEIALTGPDQAVLNAVAHRASEAIGDVRGVVDAASGVVYDDASLRLSPRGARLAALGLIAPDLGDALAARTQGTIAALLPGESAAVPVRVRVAGTPSAGSLADAPMYTRSGATTVGALARLDRPPRPSEITEENGRRVVRVTANIEGASLSTVVADVRAFVPRLGLPPAYAATIGGAYQTQQASFAEFRDVIAIAVVLVFGVMLATFGSFRLPLVILCAIPLALVGVVGALFVTRTPVNVSSFMGLLLLVGIVVKNGILLVDVANRRLAAGDDVAAALVEAGSTRVRPIVMTTLAAIGGLFPLALGLGSGAEMERPLAIAVIGGLSTATAFTLVLIPVLYATFIGAAPRRAQRTAAATGMLVVALAVVARPGFAQSAPSSVDRVPTMRFARIDVAAAQVLAVASSPDVALARAAVDGARASLAQARGTGGLSLVGAYVEAPQGAPGGTIAQRLTSYGAQLNLNDLASFGGLVDQAKAAQRAAEYDALAAERAERVKLVGLYYAALDARAIAAARNDALAAAQRQLAAAQTRFTAGDAPRLDVVRAQVAVARAQGDLAAARAADGSATDALAWEVGRPPASFAALEPTPEPLDDAEPPSPETAVAMAFARRTDLRSADAEVSAAAAAVSAARVGVLPTIQVGAGYARGVDSGVATSGPTLSASLAVPVGGGGAAARVHAQRAVLAAARAKREAVARSVALEVGAAARTSAAAREAEAAARSALRAASAELDGATLGYANGAATSLEVNAARATYVQAVVDASTARYERLRAQAVLDLEIGT